MEGRYSFTQPWSDLLVSLLLGTLLLFAIVSFAFASESTTFSGRATAVDANVLGIRTAISDTGDLPPQGGAMETSLLAAEVAGLLTAEVLHASAVGRGEESRAESSLADARLTVGGNTIAASFLMARASAVCTGRTAAPHGSSHLAEVAVNGQSVMVTGEPNQTVELPNGRIVINEQTSSQRDGEADMTVVGLHVVVNGVADVALSRAHADISCGQPICDTSDFVTGGGWIVDSSGGSRTNFGVAGGIRQSIPWGHLTFVDHGRRMKVHGTSITGYTVVDAVTRRITGFARVDGNDGYSFVVDVSDRGEPGRDDTFAIRLSNGYYAAGQLDGGNIQLHGSCK